MAQARVSLEIDSSALLSNLAGVVRQVSPCRVTAVIKADAYGTGVKKTAEIARRAGVSRFAVADVNEAVEIADAGLPVQILGTLDQAEAAEAVDSGFICPVTGIDSAKILSREAVKQKRSVNCQIKIDSGMGRFGIAADGEAFEQIIEISKLPGLEIKGLYSHFSSAGTPGNDYTLEQLARFKALHLRLAAAGVCFEDIHIAASDGITFYPESWQKPFSMVRCGIFMYGCEKVHLDAVPWLKPVLSLKSRVAAVRKMAPGSFVGYGHTHKVSVPSMVGTVLAGYADGIPRALSNRGYVIIRGVLCPVIGRVSMDCMNVLLNNVPDAVAGDEVVCIGRSGEYEITVSDWAALKDTPVHEVMCSIGNRVERRFL